MDLEAFDKARAIALKSLASSARSQSEIERRLRRAEADEEAIAKIIEEFTSRGWLDDPAFAQAWVEDRADRKRYGKTRLAQELRGRGIDKETIQSTLAEVSDEDEAKRAREAATARWAKTARLELDRNTLRNEKQKLGQFLMRRGFSSSIVRQVIEEVTSNKD